MTPNQFREAMQMIKDAAGDTEVDHGKADELLCDLLDSLGYDEGITIYREIEKWYA
jgi:hypothetical protein